MTGPQLYDFSYSGYPDLCPHGLPQGDRAPIGADGYPVQCPACYAVCGTCGVAGCACEFCETCQRNVNPWEHFTADHPDIAVDQIRELNGLPPLAWPGGAS